MRNQAHPAGVTSYAMGNAQGLPNGDTLAGRGSTPGMSKFSPAGDPVYDATLPLGPYRVYLADRAPTPQ